MPDVAATTPSRPFTGVVVVDMWFRSPLDNILLYQKSRPSQTADMISVYIVRQSKPARNMRFRILPLLCILGVLAGRAAADEGMWLFNSPPNAKIKTKYGFEPTAAWLNHLQLSSIRFDNGGSGAFVSADGLALTNHHVASDCLQNLSNPRQDYRKTGFYARSQEQEPRCPSLELNVVQQITDVTARVNTGVKPGMPDADAGKLQRAAMAAIEKECATAADIRCDVVTLYSGALFHLYKYKKYTDVRLVFAPEVD